MKLRLLVLGAFVCNLFSFPVHAQIDIPIGTGTAVNAGTTYPCPLQDYYEGSRAQYLYRASELTAAGMAPGTITALKFNITSLGTFSGAVEQFAVRITNTSTTTLTATTWEMVPTAYVYGPVDYVPTVGNNNFTFTSPFNWDGTSNVLVEVCNGGSAYTSNPFVTWTTGLAFNGSHTYRADGGGSLCGTASVTNSGTQTTRPNIIFSYTPAGACSGAPNAGTTTSNNTNITCYGSPFTLSLTGNTVASGLTYQWQYASTTSGPWTDLPGATTYNYTTSQTVAARYYRAVVSCGTNSNPSTPVLINSVGTPPYATLPFQEQFENPWINACSTRDVPTTSWSNTPGTGNSSWRRDDDGSAAAWTSPTLGAYTPTGSNNTPHSARFHSYNSGTTPGQLDIYINANTTIANKRLVFDYINTSGTDSLDVLVSTDGGTNFTRYLTLKLAATWANQNVDFTTTSATAIIRFKAVGGGITDIGIDEINIFNLVNCTGTPAAGTVSASLNNVCPGNTVNLSVTGQTYGQAGISYQWQSSTNNTNWFDITGATSLVYNFTVPATYVSTYYRLVVRCSFSSQTVNSNGVFVATPAPVYATLPLTETFEAIWISRCDTRDVPNSSWRNTPFTGNASWRRDDDGTAASWSSNSGAYTPAGSNGSAHSARFHSYDAVSGTQGSFDLYLNCNTSSTTKRLRFDYINTSGTDTLTILLSTDNGATFIRLDSMRTAAAWRTKTILFNSTSATSIVRFLATSDYGVTDIGLDNITVISFPNCSGTPVGGTATASQTTACIGSIIALSLTGQSVDQGGLTYKWQSSTNNTTWTDISTPSTEPTFVYTIPSGFTNTYFRAIDSCSYSGAFAASTSVLVSVPAPTYVSFPLIQSFDSVWVTSCATRDVPSATGWRNVPFTGNNSWRRDNDTTGGGWANMLGTPASAGAAGTARYARFHTYSATAGSAGNLDLYVNCSPTPADKELSFWYINPAGSDSLRVLLSIDGGINFTPIGFRYTTNTDWAKKIIAFTSSSATTVIRFAGYGTGDFSTDIGIDEVNVKSVECAQPPNITSTVTSPSPTQSVAVLNWRPVYNALGYEIVISTSADEPNYGDITGDTTITYSNLLPVTTYYVFVRTLCFNGVISSWYTYTFTTPCPSQPLPYAEGFETITTANQLPDCMAATGLGTNVLTYTAAQTTYNRTPHSGSKFASIRYSTPVGGAWLFTQPFTLTGGTNYDASFWYRTDGLAGWQILGLYYGTSQNAASMIKIDSITNVTSTEYLQMIRTFRPPTSGIYYLGIKVVALSNPWYLSIDDLGLKTSAVVPVTLLNFTGETRNGYNQLTWTTATEMNSKGFSIERSKDGVNFTPIEFVASKAVGGSSTTQLTYTYQDNKPLAGANYYRLKQTDKDDRFAYSNTVLLKGARVYELQLVSVYPNPTITTLNVTVASPKSDKIQLLVTDMVGKQLYQTTQEVQQGDNNLKLNVASLAKGSYILKMICQDGCNAGLTKFIKE